MGYGGGSGFGGGGGGGTPSPYLSISAATILKRTGSTASASDQADNVLRFTIPSGTATRNGTLQNAEIAAMWALGGTVTPGTLEHVLEWAAAGAPSQANLILFVGRGTLPTNLTELENLNGLWMETRGNASNPGQISTWLKNGVNNVSDGAFNENKADSEAVSHAVSIDDQGMGHHMLRHTYAAGVQPRTAGHTKTPTSGTVVLAALYFPRAVPGSDTDIDFKVKRTSDPVSA